MRLGVLFSGGKDSCMALHLTRETGHDIACLLTVLPRNPESFLFHTPNIDWTAEQAKAIGVPHLTVESDGKKESEVEDLRRLLALAQERFGIKGVATGAIESVYQAERIQRVCAALGLWVFNPLWKRDQTEHLRELLTLGFEVLVVGVFAEHLDEDWLGRRLDSPAIEELISLARKGIQPAGEGGELETFVLFAPGWRQRIQVTDCLPEFSLGSGILAIHSVRRLPP